MIKIVNRARDPEFIRRLRLSSEYEPFRELLRKRWKQEGERELPELLFSSCVRTFETGNRTVFEKRYFERRRALNLAALLTIIYPDEPRYLKRLEDVIFSVCNEYSWCISAHLPTITELSADHIDLFASETAYALAEIHAILTDRLSPLILARIRCEVERRILVPYTDGRRYSWETASHSWSAVCLAGVVASVIYLFPERFDELRPRFDSTVRSFLSGFGEDGICLEGIGYWSYAFGFFVCLADLVFDFTDGQVDYFSLPGASRAAKYPQRVLLSRDCTVSFSDAPTSARFHVGLLHELYRRFGNELQFSSETDYTLAEGCAHWCLDLRKLLWFDPDLKLGDQEESGTFYGKDAEWFIRKAPRYSLAAKGGHNAEPHNHNDVGSFIVAQNGLQIFADCGSGTYTKQYFHPDTRYEYLNCSSLGHSVAYFGEHCQKHGEAYRATILSADENEFSIEMSGAYGIEALRSYTRSFCTADTSITLTDTFETDGALPITERFLLSRRPRFEKSGIRIGDIHVTFADSAQKVTLIEYTHEKLHTEKANRTELWLMDVSLSPDTRSFEMKMEFCGD